MLQYKTDLSYESVLENFFEQVFFFKLLYFLFMQLELLRRITI